MSSQLTPSEAHSILANNARNPKKLSKKVLNYLGAQQGSMMSDGTVVFSRNGVYEMLNFEEFAAIAYERESLMLKNYSAETIIAEREINLNRFHDLFKNGNYDYSTESLIFIDKYVEGIQKQGYADADFFIPLVTYIGEVFIRATNGKWSDAANAHKNVVVVGENGKEYDPYICVRKILVNKKSLTLFML